MSTLPVSDILTSSRHL